MLKNSMAAYSSPVAGVGLWAVNAPMRACTDQPDVGKDPPAFRLRRPTSSPAAEAD